MRPMLALNIEILNVGTLMARRLNISVCGLSSPFKLRWRLGKCLRPSSHRAGGIIFQHSFRHHSLKNADLLIWASWMKNNLCIIWSKV